MNKCAQRFLIKLLSALVCMALWGSQAAAQQPTPGQNISRVSGVAGGFSALRIPECLLNARATVLGKEISRGLKLGMEETNYAG